MSEQGTFMMLTDLEGHKILVNISQVLHISLSTQKRTCLLFTGQRRVCVKETLETIAQQVLPLLLAVPVQPPRNAPARKADPQASIIGHNVKRYRLEQGLSQRRLLERLGSMHKRTYYNIEAGRRVPSASQLQSLAQALEVSEDDLLHARPLRTRKGAADSWGTPFLPFVSRRHG